MRIVHLIVPANGTLRATVERSASTAPTQARDPNGKFAGMGNNAGIQQPTGSGVTAGAGASASLTAFGIAAGLFTSGGKGDGGGEGGPEGAQPADVDAPRGARDAQEARKSMHDKAPNLTAETLLGGILGAPLTTTPLYRSFKASVAEVEQWFPSRRNVDLGLTSFGHDTEPVPEANNVMIKLKSGAAASDLSAFSLFPQEGEHVASGRFQVLAVDTTVTPITIAIRQVGKFDPGQPWVGPQEKPLPLPEATTRALNPIQIIDLSDARFNPALESLLGSFAEHRDPAAKPTDAKGDPHAFEPPPPAKKAKA